MLLKIIAMKFKFTYTRLFVEDYKACYKFYHDLLGLEATFTSETDTYIELTDGSVKLTLLNRKEIIGHFGRETPLFFNQKNDSVALSFLVDDVEAACGYLKEKEVEIVRPPWNFADWGIKAALVRDPDGNLIELSQMGEMVGAE